MNNGRNDCQRISRRVLLTGTALALGAAAVAAASQAMAQVKISQAVANYQNTPPALRPLHQLPTAECVQIRPGRHQPERLVPVVCAEDLVLVVPDFFARGTDRAPGATSGRPPRHVIGRIPGAGRA
jgi:hypothetical protein